MKDYHCSVCGYLMDELPWGANNLTPSYEICPCCGMEFGFEDYRLDLVRTYRQKCIDQGAVWFDKKDRPSNWDLMKQLKNIPPGWK